MKEWLKLWRGLIDFLLPRSVLQKEIEDMTVADFWEKGGGAKRRLGGNIISLFNYKNKLVRTAIWQVKYRNHRKIVRMLAEILYSELIEELFTLSQFENFQEPILVPIPMSASRKKARGYNQTENLARHMAWLDSGRSFSLRTDLLIKTKETPPQSSLPRTLRLENLHGAFHIKIPTAVGGRNIILLDDVTTTGATLNEASATLLRAGARKIISMVIAH